MTRVRATSRAVRRTFVKVPDKITGPTKVKVGFVKGKTDSDVINRAIWNEFGTKGSGKGFGSSRGGGFGGPIPERPFMRNAARQMAKKYREQLTRAARAIVEGRSTMKQVLEKLGLQAVGDIQREITSLTSPENSPLTIALKGSSNPLIDTGEMRQAVTYKVDGK